LYELVNEDHALTNAIRATEAKLKAAHIHAALIRKMETWQQQVPQPPMPGGAIDKIGYPSSLLSTQILHTLSVADGPAPITEGVRTRTAELAEQWARMKVEGERLLAQAGRFAVREGDARVGASMPGTRGGEDADED
jgi:hypothetical protein